MIELRELAAQDIGAALELVWKVFCEFEAPEYPQAGVDEFRGFLDSEQEIAKLQFYAAFDSGKIIGVIAMRRCHISLFFVDSAYHRQGIGKALFRYMISRLRPETVTVNSSPYAVPVYLRLGFTQTDTRQITNGIIYVPMICLSESLTPPRCCHDGE